jgi:hypothetical protein
VETLGLILASLPIDGLLPIVLTMMQNVSVPEKTLEH